MTVTLTALQKQRRDTASNWTSNNTVLLAGEWGIESDTKKFKIGDGTTAWQSLDYVPIPDANRLLTGDLTIAGSLTVNGTTTTISTQNLLVEDKNIEIGKVSTPTDTTADGGGITLKGATDKTFNWLDATDSWTSSENIALGDNKKLQLGDTQDLQIYHDSNNSVIDSNTGNLYLQSANNLFIQGANNDNIIKYIANGSLELYHDNVKKAETSANGLDLPDNSKLQLGDSQDLQVFWDGSSGFVTNQGGGNLHFNSDTVLIKNAANSKSYIRAYNNSSVELYHNNVKKAETSATGFDVTGDIVVSGNVDGRDIAADGAKLDNIESNATADQTKSDIDALGIAASTATTLANARTIAGTSFDGSSNIDINYNNLTNKPTIPTNNNELTNGAGYITATLTNEQVQDIVGAMLSGNTETGITVTYDDTDGNIDFVVASQTDNNFTNALLAILNGLSSSAGVLSNGVTATTQSASDNSTKVATTAYTDTAISNLVDSSPSALNTLNELAAALGDDANFSTTVTNSIATKMPLAGGEFTGNITVENILPDADSSRDLGSSSNRFSNIYADNLYGNGSNITNVPAANLTGTASAINGSNITNLPAANLTGTASAINGSNITNLSAANLTGTASAINGSNITNLTAGNLTGTLPAISAANLTNIPAANITGTLPAIDGSNLTNVSASIANNSITTSKLADMSQNTILGRVSSGSGDPTHLTAAEVRSMINVENGATADQTKSDIDALNINADQVDGVDASGFVRNNNGAQDINGSLTCDDIIVAGAMLHEGDTNTLVHFTANDEISLKTNGSTRLRAHNSGVNVTGDLIVSAGVKATNNYAGDDNVKLKLGTGDDLQLYHDGNDSYVDASSGTGDLYIKSADDIYLIANGSDSGIDIHGQGAVELFHNGSKKFETTSAGATVTGALTATGDVTAFSDESLKKDITTIENAIDICSKLRGVSYKWIKDDKASIGVIAQEVEKVIPEVVHTTEHEGAEVKSVDYGKIVGVLINAINEQQAKWDVWMELLKDIRKMENKLIEVIGNY